MSQQLLYKKKKKEKAKRKGISASYEGVDQNQRLKTLAEIRERIRITLKYHIGKDNALSVYDFFVNIIGVAPYELDTFKRWFWWDIIKKVCAEMRRELALFVIIERSDVYVLKTNSEAERFKTRLQHDIDGLQKAQLRANEWVKGELWRKI